MNAMTNVQPSHANTNARSNSMSASTSTSTSTIPTRPTRRERDFGVGYGNSSGYASPRQYVSNWAPPRFKFA
ncbi:MAG: hypothetical protein ACYC42_01685 [Lysobacter sp.]